MMRNGETSSVKTRPIYMVPSVIFQIENWIGAVVQSLLLCLVLNIPEAIRDNTPCIYTTDDNRKEQTQKNLFFKTEESVYSRLSG